MTQRPLGTWVQGTLSCALLSCACSRIDVAGVLTTDVGASDAGLPSALSEGPATLPLDQGGEEFQVPPYARRPLVEAGEPVACSLARGEILYYQVLTPSEGPDAAAPPRAEWLIDSFCRYWARVGPPSEPMLHGALSQQEVSQLRTDFAPANWPNDDEWDRAVSPVPDGRVLLTDGIARLRFQRSAPDIPAMVEQLVARAARWAETLAAKGGVEVE